jgi:hypothetical protein
MRRTLLSILVAVVAFAVTSVLLIGGFQLIAGSSERPTQGSSTHTSDAADEPESSAPSPSVAPHAAAGSSSTGPFGTSTIGIGVSGALPEVNEPEPLDPEPTAGVLSEDFTKLGLDDPTTKVDESVKSACDTVEAVPVAGQALCRVVK